ncbi:hypothetical protein [Paenibacillus macerans]|uniref:hypothetical protein n=1 Tax=Paenibacillus macerans TaxID=44252 RepID=UPI00203ACCA2|nr:hypothetical protein [Paenibacillus macerans]MCM3701311.1 hypothetical protein [Paenibacillus macerans]
MNRWKDAWVIFKRDLCGDRLYLIWNVLFMLYMALMMSFMFEPGEREASFLKPLADFMLLLLIPFTGFYFSRRSFNYLKEDSYTQMLRFYRTLPISADAVILGRIIQLVTATLFNGVLFYPGLYLLAASLRSELSSAGYIAFALTWCGYGLLLNGAYIYFEFLKKGSTYLWMSLAAMVLVALLAFVVNGFGGNLIELTVGFSGRYALLSPLMWGSLVCGTLGLLLFASVTKRKLAVRDLA